MSDHDKRIADYKSARLELKRELHARIALAHKLLMERIKEIESNVIKSHS